MPLNRLEDMQWARWPRARAVDHLMARHAMLAELCAPLVAAMREDAFEATFCTDATGVLVQNKMLPHWRFWVIVAPGRH